MKNTITFRIVLLQPPAGVDFGLQKGSGHQFEPVQIQRSGNQDLLFMAEIELKGDQSTHTEPDFGGPFVQGPKLGRFIYIGIGTFAGQADTYSRRLKIPLTGIDWGLTGRVTQNADLLLEARVAGTGKDGTPNCATVKPFTGWHVMAR